MLTSAKVFCLILLIIVCSIRTILGDCTINLPSPPLAPIFYKYVGSHKLKINTYNNGVLQVHQGQKFEAYCDKNFKSPESYQTSNKLYLRCKDRYIYISNDSPYRNEDNFYQPTLECSDAKWNLYESLDNFMWCPSNVTSYILARSKHLVISTPIPNYEKLAGICYDIYNSSFYSVYYTLAPNNPKYEQLSPLGNLYEPVIEIKYIEETFKSNRNSENVYDDDQFEKWINSANYDFNLIIQHSKLNSIIHYKFLPLLEFLWWSNLRLYNWKRYTDALEKHVENDNQAYDILAGVSGAIKVPIIESCKNTYSMEKVLYNSNQHIPLYVWNYLQNTANISNEFVIIGFNSPFNEFYSQDDIIFCPNKCQDIPWLKEVSSSFHYGIMGTVFCCDVDDVRSSKRLEDFPNSDLKPKPAELTTLNYETTELDEHK